MRKEFIFVQPFRRKLVALSMLAVAALLASCGGNTSGSDGSSSTGGTNSKVPSIMTQPQSVTAIDGTSVAFNVVANGNGGGALSYQWRANGVPIANATDSTFTLKTVQYGLSGTPYSVAVVNGAGTVTSEPATLTVTPVKPTITTQPSPQSAVAGGTAIFSVVAAGTTPLTYQWQKNGVAIPGAAYSTWSYQGAKLADNGARISVIITNIAGTVTSSAVQLSVTSTAPAIITQPQAQTVIAPASATFSVAASGAPPLGFQWSRNGVAIVGATNASYETPPTSISNNGDAYQVTVSNAVGSVTSGTVTLTVNVLVVPPSITSEPQSAGGAVGSSLTFTVAANGSQPLSYQWQANGVNLPGANASSYTVSPVLSQDNNVGYTVVVSNTAGTVTSSAAVLTVTGPQAGISLIAGELGGYGTNDSTAAVSRFYQPESVAVDATGNVFVADTYNSDINEITVAGNVIPLAGSSDLVGSLDGVGGSALFNYPEGIAVDSNGNVYVADTGNQTIRKITSAGVVTTIAGTVGTRGSTDGPGNVALFNFPRGIATDSAGNVYVADSANATIRMINTTTGLVSTIAGTPGVAGSTNGPAASAQFYGPYGVAVDASGNIYIADAYNDEIRLLTPGSNPTVSTLAGAAGVAGSVDGTGPAARFDHPRGIAVDPAGTVFVADTNAGTIRMVTPAGIVTTVAGTPYAPAGYADGTAGAAQFNYAWGIATDAVDNLYVADFYNDTIRKITPAAAVTTYAGTAPHPGSVDGVGGTAQFNGPVDATVDPAGNIYVVDSSNSTIRAITSSGVVSTLAGSAGSVGSLDGSGRAAQFDTPQALATDSNGNVYVADTGNNTIREVTAAGVVSTLAGTPGATGSADGTAAIAQFNSPQGIVVDAANNVYVADTGNNVIRMITPAGVVTTVAGTAGATGGTDGVGAAAQFNTPIGLAIDSTGNIYIADSNNYTIREFVPATGAVTTLAGYPGQAGYSDGIGTDARFNVPTGVAVDTAGNVYVVDSFFQVIRMISPTAVVTTVAGVPGVKGVALGPLPGSFNSPIGIAIMPGSSAVQLVVPDRGENAVLQVTLP